MDYYSKKNHGSKINPEEPRTMSHERSVTDPNRSGGGMEDLRRTALMRMKQRRPYGDDAENVRRRLHILIDGD